MKKLILLFIALPIIALGQEEMVINADDINMVIASKWNVTTGDFYQGYMFELEFYFQRRLKEE